MVTKAKLGFIRKTPDGGIGLEPRGSREEAIVIREEKEKEGRKASTISVFRTVRAAHWGRRG